RRAPSNNHRVCALVLARALERRSTPRSLGLATNRRAPLTTTVRVVVGVHCRTTNVRALAHVTAASSLTDLEVLMIHVANLTKCGHAAEVNHANFTARHAQLAIVVDLGHQLGTC